MEYIEYIQNGSSGTRYSTYNFDFGYYPTSGTEVNIKINYGSSSTDGRLLFGSMGNAGDFYRFFTYQQNKMIFDCPTDSNARLSVDYTFGTDAVFNMHIVDNTVYLTNETTSSFNAGSMPRSLDGNQTLKLWGGDNVYGGTKIYYIKIWENGGLAMDLRPAIDNNVIGLYDKVNGVFYSNSLAGTMIAGPRLSSISATYTGPVILSSGGTANIYVESPFEWTASTSASFVTLSTLTGTSATTAMTATFDANSGDKRTARIDYINSYGDTAFLEITQRKYSSGGTPVFLGGDEVTEIFLGDNAVSEAYLGTDLVFSS